MQYLYSSVTQYIGVSRHFKSFVKKKKKRSIVWLLALKKIAGLSELCFRFNFKVGDVRMLSNGRALLLFSFLSVWGDRTRIFENQFM